MVYLYIYIYIHVYKQEMKQIFYLPHQIDLSYNQIDSFSLFIGYLNQSAFLSFLLYGRYQRKNACHIVAHMKLMILLCPIDRRTKSRHYIQ